MLMACVMLWLPRSYFLFLAIPLIVKYIYFDVCSSKKFPHHLMQFRARVIIATCSQQHFKLVNCAILSQP